ncbi:MAG: acetyl-CoA hydrolase, partial [Muribaculaceae bacterium]|nr:acetyl-CoA hydrolase [Muribaculaceae bacterium]
SAIVPMVSHVDHTDHCARVIVTEQGVADLRGKDPRQRALHIIENCVHPDYKEIMWDYLKLTPKGHMPHNLRAAFALHQTYQECGDMRKVDFSRYI